MSFLILPILAACLHAEENREREVEAANPVADFGAGEHPLITGSRDEPGPDAAEDTGLLMDGIAARTPTPVTNTAEDTSVGRGAEAGLLPATASPPPEQPPSRGERIMKALAQAYPDRIGPAVFRDGDWAVPVRGVWYYYAEGRLLPQELRSRAAEYDPQPFYNYYAELPAWRTPTAEESERFRAQAQQRLQHPVKRSQHFHDALWRATNRNESWDRAKSMRFLGRSVYVHYSIMEELALVEELILEESKTNAQVRQWINSIDVLDGWNWRNIADTESRSFHSYGAALDLLPTSTGNLETYWLWTARTRSDWWMVPYSQRLHPPAAVIRAFESYGFVWGGKWTSYDTMHFEYRPEIFILNNLPLSTLR
ncbi:MAG: M15 family metallopeptidase [Treponema sp.]|nr:M15 family metallopeptidase [Treponema sp.]